MAIALGRVCVNFGPTDTHTHTASNNTISIIKGTNKNIFFQWKKKQVLV